MSDNQDINLEDLVFFEEEEHGDIPTLETSDNQEETVETSETEVDETPVAEEATEEVDEAVEEENDEVDETPEAVEDPNTEAADQDSIDSDDDDSGQTELSNYFNFMAENNLLVLGEDFEFDGSVEKFEEAIEQSQNNLKYLAAQEIWQQLPSDFQVLLEYGLNGGKDINHVKDFINVNTDFSTIDMENETTQVDVLRDYYKRTTRMSDSKIERHIERLRDADALEEEAIQAKSELSEIYQEEKNKLLQQSQAQEAEYQQQIEQSYNSFTNTVKQMQLPQGKQEKIINSIWSLGYGEDQNFSYFNYVDQQIRSNPQHLAQLAELYLDYDPNKGFVTDKLEKKVESKVNRSFRDKLDKLTGSSGPTVGGKKRGRKKKPNATHDLSTWYNNRI